MSKFTLSDYKLQAYLLANAEQLKRLAGKDKFSLNQYIKKLEGSTTKEEIAANALNASNTVDFVADLPHKIMQKLKLEAKVYKVFINNTDDDNTPREIDILLDAYEVYTDDGVYRPLQRADLSSEEARRKNPGDPGVQIENIEIVRLGGNPAEIDTNITVKISLFATSLQQYFTRFGQTDTAAILVDPNISEEIKLQARKGVGWIDLIKVDLDDGLRSSNPYLRLAKKFGIEVLRDFNALGSTLGYNNEQQRIKLKIGYRNPHETLTELLAEGELEGYTTDDIDRYAAQVEAQTEVYYLNLHQNAFTFNSDDGSVNLQIDYVASTGTTTIDRKNDLLFDPYLHELELRANDSICEIQKEIDTDQLIVVTTDYFAADTIALGEEGRLGGTPSAVHASTLDHRYRLGGSTGNFVEVSTREEKQQALKDLDNFKKRLQVLQANKLINGLYAASLHPKKDFLPLVVPSLGGRQIKGFTRSNLLFIPATNVTGKINQSLGGTRYYNLGLFYRSQALGLTGGQDFAPITDLRELQKNAQGSGDLTDLEDAIENNLGNQIDDDEVNLEFVFFGDIVETAFEVLSSNNRIGERQDSVTEAFEYPSRNVRIVRRSATEGALLTSATAPYWSAADTEFYVEPFYYQGGNADARVAELYKEYGEMLFSNVTYKNPADVNNEITISLADVPIAMVEFKKWFTKNISTKRKKHMFIKNYLESLTRWVSKQIGDAVSSDQSTTTDLEPPELLINRYFLNVYKYDFLPLVTNSNPNLQYLENRIVITNLSNYVDNQAISPSLNSKVLTIIGQTPGVKFSAARAGVKLLDRDDKIPHILFAEPTKGMLYNINFQREDMPGLREARLFEGSDMYGLEILREKYNATLEFYGNNFFKPGTMIYIDPGRLNIADFGYTQDNRSPARLLGLGGYHLVIRVTHEVRVADNAWMTIVDTQWQTFGADDGVYGDRDEIDNCVTSITGRYQLAQINSNNPQLQQNLANRALDEVIQTGYTGDIEDLAELPGSGFVRTPIGIGIDDDILDPDNAPVGVFLDED